MTYAAPTPMIEYIAPDSWCPRVTTASATSSSRRACRKSELWEWVQVEKDEEKEEGEGVQVRDDEGEGAASCGAGAEETEGCGAVWRLRDHFSVAGLGAGRGPLPSIIKFLVADAWALMGGGGDHFGGLVWQVAGRRGVWGFGRVLYHFGWEDAKTRYPGG